MQVPSYKELLDSGVHFGHLKRKWNPKMQPYIFMERRGIHIIDLKPNLRVFGARWSSHHTIGQIGAKDHVRSHQKAGS